MLVLSDRNLATSTTLGVLNIYNSVDLVLIKQKILSSGIYTFKEVSNKYLFVGLKNGKIIILNTFDLSTFKELSGHTDVVISLVNLQNGYYSSLSKDNTIKIWNIEKLSLNTSFNTGQNNGWYALYSLNDSIISVGFDGINVYDKKNYALAKSFSETLTWDNSLAQLINGDIIFSSKEDYLNIWDTKTWTYKRRVYCGVWPYSVLVLNNGNLAVGLKNGSILILNTSNEFSLVKSIDTKTNPVFSLVELENSKIAAGHLNSLFTVWDY